MIKILSALTPAFVLGIILSLTFIIPEKAELQASSMSMDLPLRFDLSDWYGIRRQESPAERRSLAPDTLFSKADYRLVYSDEWDKAMPDVHVSLVFSGNDMNQSIHRPEMCLPGQGHLNLLATNTMLTLNNGKEVKFTRLTTFRRNPDIPDKKLHYIHYYTFVGKGNIRHSHTQRAICDILDRTLKGKVQRWAYCQIGTYWSPHLGITQEDADRLIQKLISQLLPQIINWEEMEN
ncbi:MAG: exosortase-associated EpsI family protein [Akkermansia sp.]|nr:exosortase-associated EpsI family protein [Akkermansia sp.]